MKNLTCSIVDDEPLALDLLESYVSRTDFLELRGRHSSAEAALSALSEDPVDLLFLDIQMPGLLGTDLAPLLGRSTQVVFSTAFPQYALEGFQLDAVDYLLKPYDYPRFLKAALKARELQSLRHDDAAAPEAAGGTGDFFFVRCGFRQVRVDVERILYIEGVKDYARIVLDGPDRPLLTLMSLKSLEEKLQGKHFLRVHRSWIVHLRRVDAVEKGMIQVGGRSIPIADKYRAIVDETLRSV